MNILPAKNVIARHKIQIKRINSCYIFIFVALL